MLLTLSPVSVYFSTGAASPFKLPVTHARLPPLHQLILLPGRRILLLLVVDFPRRYGPRQVCLVPCILTSGCLWNLEARLVRV